MRVKEIYTNFEHPPIPVRYFDWSAVWDDYSGEPDEPKGYGVDEQAAIDNLIDKTEH